MTTHKIRPLSPGLSAALALLCILLPTITQAAQLQDITLTKQPAYLEVTLSFDARPKYDESLRFSPDRYLMTFSGCKSTLAPDKAKALGAIDSAALSRISVYGGADNIALGFYVPRPARPLVSPSANGYTLRFYLDGRLEDSVQLAAKTSLVRNYVGKPGLQAHLFILKIAPGAPVALETIGADRFDGKTRLRAPTSFAAKAGALAVINGGFFGKRGEHLTTFVERGVMRACGVYPARPMLVLSKNGQAAIGRYNALTALRFAGKTLPVNAMNYPFENGRVIVYDASYPLDTLPQEAMFYYVIKNGQLAYYSSDTKGLSLGPGELLLATDIMPEVNPLKAVPKDAQVALETAITDAAGQAVTAESAIGGAPMLVVNGAVQLSIKEDMVKDDIAKSERSRTAVGLTRDGTLILLVAKEDEAAGIGGLTLKALAEIMIEQGAVTALNLDGGGSSAMVAAGMLLNEPEGEQRPVSNVLAVTVKP